MSQSLVASGRAVPLPPVQLARAATTAMRFGSAYARSIYLRRRPELPGASSAVERDLAAAATRIPVGRRGRHPRAGEITVQAIGARRVEAAVEILDEYHPAFAIAFSMRRVGGSWLVVSISSPE